MNQIELRAIQEALAASGPDGLFRALADRLREQKQYPLLFECRLMAKRYEMGLPLIQADTPDLSEKDRQAYDRAFIEAAKETGSLFLADGEIARAWPYFRASGNTAPIAQAIEKAEGGEGVEPIIEIAYHERVNPRKGFELVLQTFGTCRAISFFEQYPDKNGREESLRLLVRTLYEELRGSLRRTIGSRESEPDEDASVRDLISGRDWLFGEHDYYVDTSHVVSVLRFCLDSTDRQTLQLAVELAEYGEKLSPMFRYRGDPPFDDCYPDHRAYLRALLGEDEDGAILHFRAKLTPEDPMPAQVLVVLLVRLKRYSEAVQVALEHLQDLDASMLVCPPVQQLCQLAGDFERLEQYARERGDALSFAAALLKGERVAT